jgi:hypothetical protein
MTTSYKFTLELTAREVEARTLFNAALTHPKADYTDIGIARVFVGDHWAAFTFDQLLDAVAAKRGFKVTQFTPEAIAELRAALNRLMRAKALRSRTAQGKRWYEIAFAD